MPTRFRLTYSKQSALQYTGHLDFQQVWERTLRRSRLPVAFSQGFHPQARLHLACALPLGFTSQCEVLDFWLSSPMEVSEVLEPLQKAVPPGIGIQKIEEVDLHSPPLQVLVHSTEYTVTLLIPVETSTLAQKVKVLLDSTSLWRSRHNKDYDLRPLVESLEVISLDEQAFQRLAMRLSAREGATGRPDEVISSLGFDLADTRVERTALIITR